MTTKRSVPTPLRLSVATEGDIPALNHLFSEAFTDRYRKDGLIGVRVPQLNPAIWRYALKDADQGAMIWSDAAGKTTAFNIVHRSGKEGWMGPLAVALASQESGVGKLIVQTAVDWLKDQDVATIGLETMPRTVDNIGFYSGLGFLPQHLTVTLTGPSRPASLPTGFTLLGGVSTSDRDEILLRCQQRLSQSASGCDYTREFQVTLELGVGDALIMEESGDIRAFVLWHSAPLANDRNVDDLRVLKLFADSDAAFTATLRATEICAASLNLPNVSVRCQTAYRSAYRGMIDLGYRVRWTDLRMTLDGFTEAEMPGGEVLLSNWEI